MAVEIPQLGRTAIDNVHRKIVHPYLTHGKAGQDREVAHTRALSLMETLQKTPIMVDVLRQMFVFEDPILQTEFAGLELPNPLGMAAGFDKDAKIYRLLGEALGFGLVTVGSVTKIPYDGNPQPRIFDLPQSDGLINRMGFLGKGSDEVEKRLKEDDPDKRHFGLLISIAASRPSFNQGTQIEDYVAVAKQLLPYGDGHEINVSSPNTPGVRALQEPGVFRELMTELRNVYLPNGQTVALEIVKFGPDLNKEAREENVITAIDNGANGITLGNTTTDPEIRANLKADAHREEIGGISGLPLREKALEISHQMYVYTGGEVPIKMSGGISTAEDLWNAFTYGGASAADVYTAFVRPNTSTPNSNYYLLRDLARAMEAYGFKGMNDFINYRGKRVPFPKFP